MAIQSICGNVLITESNDVGMSSTSKLSVRCFCSNHIELLICKKGGWCMIGANYMRCFWTKECSRHTKRARKNNNTAKYQNDSR